MVAWSAFPYTKDRVNYDKGWNKLGGLYGNDINPPSPDNLAEMARYNRMTVAQCLKRAEAPAYNYRERDPFRGMAYNRMTNQKKLALRMERERTEVFSRRCCGNWPREPFPTWTRDLKDYRFFEDLLVHHKVPVSLEVYTCRDSDDGYIARILEEVLVSHYIAPSKGPKTYGWFLDRIFERMQYTLRAAYHQLDAMKTASLHQTVIPLRQDFEKRLSNIPVQILNLFLFHAELEEFVTDHPRAEVEFNMNMQENYSRFKNDYRNKVLNEGFAHFRSSGTSLRITTSKFLCAIEVEERARLYSYEAVIQLHNKVADLLSLLLYVHLSEDVSLPHKAFDITIDTIKLLQHASRNAPSSYYDLAKAFEALSVGTILKKVETYPNTAFLDGLKKDLVASSLQKGEDLRPTLRCISRLWDPLDYQFLAELGCLGKVLGHPIRTAKAAVVKQYNRVQAVKEIDPDAARACGNKVKMTILKSHFSSEERHYPPVIAVVGNLHPRVEEAISRRLWFTDPLLNHHEPFNEEMLSNLSFEQFEEVDMLDSLLETLSDKGIAPFREELEKKFADEAGNVLSAEIGEGVIPSGAEPTKARQTRAILYYLMNTSEFIDHTEFLASIASGRKSLNAYLNHMVIKMTAKELELKPEFRLFGSMTWIMRAYNQVILKFCKRFLKRYVPEQALELDEIETNRKTSTFVSTAQGSVGHTPLMMSVDVEGWNTNFRSELLVPVLKETLDAMTGTCLFSAAHLIFHLSAVYMETPDDSYVWIGQAGGVEGFHQELWMIVYIAQLHYALRGCEHPYHLICKGDDVRIAFLIRDSDRDLRGMPVIAEEIKELLVSELAKMGHKVKPDECYYSSRFFSFSKKMTIDGIALPSMFRQIQKCYGANNAFSSSLPDYVGAAFSSAHAACIYGVNHIQAYLIALFWASVNMYADPRFRSMDIPRFASHFFIPSVMGGFPVLFLDNFLVRAESDFVAAFCSTYAIMRVRQPELAVYLRAVFNQSFSAEPSYQLLTADPYSIPWHRPETALQRMGRWTRESLHANVVNQEFREILKSCEEFPEEEFVEALGSGEPLDARSISSLYEKSPYHIIRSFVKKFETSGSFITFIVNIAYDGLRSGATGELLRIEAAVQDEIQYVSQITFLEDSQMISTMLDPDSFSCPTAHAEHLRACGWGRPIRGITHPPMTHQLLIGYAGDPELKEYTENHFRLTTVATPAVDPHLTFPQFRARAAHPYHGMTTSSGKEYAPIAVPKVDQIGKNIAEILYLPTVLMLETVDTTPPECANVRDVCRHLLGYYTTRTLEELDPFTAKRQQGTRDHHLACPKYNLTIAANTLKNASMTGDDIVDTNNRFRGTGDNYRLNFMHHKCTARAVVLEHWNYPKTENVSCEYWSCVPDCRECLFALEEPDSWYTRKDVFDGQPPVIPALKPAILDNEVRLADFLSDIHGTAEIRVDEAHTPPTLEEATEVLVSDLIRKEISFASMLASVNQIHDPDPMTIEDLAHFYTRGRQISPVGNLMLLKMPMKAVYEGLKEAVALFLLLSSSQDPFNEDYNCLQTVRGLNLPWAGFMKKLMEANCSHAFLAHVAEVAGIDFDSVVTPRVNPGIAATFVGECVLKSMRASHSFPQPHLRMKITTPTAILHRGLENRIRAGCFSFLINPDCVKVVEILAQQRDPDLDGLSDPAYRAVLFMILTHVAEPVWEEDISWLLSPYQGPTVIPWFPQWQDFLNGSLSPSSLDPPPWAKELLHRVTQTCGVELDTWTRWLRRTVRRHGTKRVTELTCVQVELYNMSVSYCLVRAADRQPGLNDFEQTESKVIPVDLEGSYAISVDFPLSSGVISLMHLRFGVAQSAVEPSVISYAIQGQSVFDLTHLSRCGGYGTTSCVKLDTILRGITWSAPDDCLEGHIVCLADGHGGDTRSLCDRFPNCQIHWNSLQGSGERTGPILAYRSSPDGGPPGYPPNLRFLTQMNFGGDLRQPYVLEEMEDAVPQAMLVKCDADLPLDEERGEVARDIWRNVTVFFLRRGHPQGVLILKVFIDLCGLVASLISSLQRHFRSVRIVTVTDSHVGYERYLIAHGLRKKRMLPGFYSMPDGTLIKALRRSVDRVTQELLDMDAYALTDSERISVKYAFQSPERWLPMASMNFLRGLLPHTDPRSPLDEIITAAKKSAAILLPLVTTPVPEFKMMGSSSKTLAHKISNFVMLFRVRSFALILEFLSDEIPLRPGEPDLAPDIKARLRDRVFSDPDIITAFRSFNPSRSCFPLRPITYIFGLKSELMLYPETVRVWKAAASHYAWYINHQKCEDS